MHYRNGLFVLVTSRNLAMALFSLVLSSWIPYPNLPWVRNILPLPKLNRTLRMHHHQRLSLVGWHALGWIGLLDVTSKLNSTCSLGNLINFSLTLLVGGGQRSHPSSLTKPKKGGNGLLSKLLPINQFHTSGRMKFPPPPPKVEYHLAQSLGTKKQFYSSWSFIRQLRLTSAEVKSWWRLTKVVPIAAPKVVLSWWNWWSTISTAIPSLNTGGDTLPISFGNSS